MDSCNINLRSCETSTSDSGATSTMKSSSESLFHYTVEPEGRYVETASRKLLPVVGCEKLQIAAERLGKPVNIPLRKVLRVPKLERNLISERQVLLMSRMLFVKSPTVAHLGIGKNVCCYFSYSPSSRLHEMRARSKKATPECTLTARAPPQREIMEVHSLLVQSSEHTTRLGQQQRQLPLL